MRNQRAAITRRMQDPDFAGPFVKRCIEVSRLLGVFLLASCVYKVVTAVDPQQPDYFSVLPGGLVEPLQAVDAHQIREMFAAFASVQASGAEGARP